MIRPAELIWRDGQPYSPAFEDIYHDRDGRQEVERVFLGPAGFDALLTERSHLQVGELGFGTALNFAVVARRCLAAGVSLHFVSFEAAPLQAADLDRVARAWAGDEPVYTALTRIYPPLLHGWHQRRLFDGRITLSLFFGPADQGLADLSAQSCRPFDLWLLDGFAPDRNPDLWTEPLLATLGRTATRGTRVTTFTSAGRVRRGLAAAGFEMRRVDQRPHKRESLAGTYAGAGLPVHTPPARVTVVGAGIAGAAVARALAESGAEVQVVESATEPAAGASGIPATVMHPRLHHDGSDTAGLRAHAYAHALAAVEPFADRPGTGVRRTGALQVASPNYPVERLAAVAETFAPTGLGVQLLDPSEAAEIAGVPAMRRSGPVLWFPGACLVNTPMLTRHLLEHPNIGIQTARTLEAWPGGTAVLACGMAARGFEGAGYLELGRVLGQLDLVRPLQTAEILCVPVVGNGYVTPAPDEGPAVLAAGATYEYTPWPEDEATRRNLVHVDRLLPGGASPLRACRAERTVSSDRQPVIGLLYDQEGQASVDRYVTLGHGSMGTVTSHLGASLVAGHIRDHFEPLTGGYRSLISPLRFRTRQARRGYRFGALP